MGSVGGPGGLAVEDPEAAPGAAPAQGAPADDDTLAAYLAPTHLRWLAEDDGPGWREIESSLLFADVSGFTRLGERLARRGRIGAEQLVDAIEAVFGAMVGAVEAGGGDLLKFGGDAILALFSGDEHERRACASALEIQSSLAALRVLPGRESRLQVSAGIASGKAHLFLVGKGPRELVIAGPLASEVAIVEGVAEAGEVLISRRTAAALPENCLDGKRVGRPTLIRTPPFTEVEAPRAPAGVDPRPGLPTHLHDHEPDVGEHRTVTVGFVQFQGSDALLEEKGPVGLGRAIDAIVGAAADACRDWGITLVATDVDRDAGKVLVCAGAPTASPDDHDRILHALRSMVDREWPLPVRAGVNRGPVFTADFGPPQRRVWSVMGDAVNLAARVMGHAKPGQLLATRSALEHVRDEFERTPVEPFEVKGKTAPVEAEVIGAARAGTRAAPDAEAPMVGRDDELRTLREALAAARSGHRRIIELVGEPGIGKSRLVEAILDERGEVNLVRIQAGPYGAHSPYLALREPLRALIGCEPDASEAAVEKQLRELVGGFAPELEPWVPLIGNTLGLDLAPTPETESLQPEFARQRLNSAVAHALDMLLPDRPTMVVVEDSHWLDEASGDLLLHMLTADRATGPRRGWGASTAEGAAAETETPASAGMTAIVTRRDVPDGMLLDDVPRVMRIELEPLALDDARLLVLGGTEETLPAETRRVLIERADGNPLLLQELLAAVRSGQSIDELPDTVEALMTARIDTLPRRERRLLREASVLGVHVPVDLLTELLGAERAQVDSALSGLDDFLLPEGPGTVAFRHELLRSSAYNALAYRRRRELHARAGEAIEAAAGEEVEGQAELLAIHFHAAHRWAQSWGYSRLAGERAVRRAAPVEAAGFYAGALEAARHVRGLERAERAEVAEALGGAAELAGEYELASDAFARARKLRAGDPLAEAKLCLRQGQVAESSRHLSAALRWFTRGLGVLEPAPNGRATDSLRARLTLAHGATRLRAGRLRECLPYLDDAVALAKRSRDRAALAHAYYLLDWAHTDLGHAEAERFRDLALPIFEELEDHARQGRVLNNLGVNAQYECRWDEAVDFLERSRAAAEKAGDAVEGVGTALNNIAEIRIDQGRIDEAEEPLREALATWRAARYRVGIGTALKNLGRIATRRGNYERAKELFAQARAEFEAIGSGALVAETDAWEAERLVFAGEVREALALLDRAAAEAKRFDVTPSILAAIERLAGEASLRAGDLEAGIEGLRRSVDLARTAGADYEEALAALELAQLAAREDGAELGPEIAEAALRARETLTRLGVIDTPRPASAGALSRP